LKEDDDDDECQHLMIVIVVSSRGSWRVPYEKTENFRQDHDTPSYTMDGGLETGEYLYIDKLQYEYIPLKR